MYLFFVYSDMKVYICRSKKLRNRIMKSRKPILYLAITFALVCLYQLSFTWKVNNVDKAASQYASENLPKNLKEKLVELDSTLVSLEFETEDILDPNFKLDTFLDSLSNDSIKEDLNKIFTNYRDNFDNILKDLEKEYIQKESMFEDGTKKEIFLGRYSYQDCKEREINLGLDLKGGMNVTLEVSVKDVLISLSGKNNDSTFRTALKTAEKNLENSQTSFVELFSNEFSPEGNELASIFGTRTLRDKIQGKNNAEVIKVINSEVTDAVESTFDILRSRIDRFGVTQPNIQKTNVPGRIIVELPGIKDPDRAKKLLQSSAQLEFWETFEFSEIAKGYDLANSYLVKKSGFERDTTLSDTIVDQSAAELPLFQTLTPSVNAQGQPYPGPIVGQCFIKDTSKLNTYFNDEEFMSNFSPDVKFVYGYIPNDDVREKLCVITLKKKGINGYVMDGGVISDAFQVLDEGKVKVSMAMNLDGTNIWKNTTGSNIGKSVAIVLDGFAKSWPIVNDEIPTGRSEISGDFSVNEGQDLANVLKSGKLPAPAHITQEAIIGPSLGQDSIDSGLKSFIIALLIVLVYMIFYYYGAGLVSNAALLANIFFIFGVLSSLGAVLTLPGIAGIVLTIGMSVDANVLIYERIREELANGKGVKLAIEDGYKSAYSSIIDANVTTLLTGIILFSFGTGPIKGFATTLIIGIITSLFSAIFITRLIISARMKKNKSMSFSIKLTHGAFKNLNIDFIGKRKVFYVLSSGLILFGGYSLATRGLNYGIDFVGGRTYIVSFSEDVDKDKVVDGLATVFNGQAPSVSSFNLKGQTGEQLKITTKYRIDENNLEADNDVKAKLFEGLDNMNYSYSVESQEKVGPTIADDIRDTAFMVNNFFFNCYLFVYID